MSPRWLLGLVLAASLASTVQAQPGSRCTQPSPVGCALTLGEPATARLQSVGEVHLWWLQLAGRQPLRVVLSGAVADYELYIVQPGGRLVGAATSIAGADAVVVVPDAAPGDYLMTVRSPTGVVHVNPYQLLAQRAPGFGPTTLPPATPVPVATAEPTPLVQPTATAVRDPAELRPFAPIRFGTDVVNRELVGEAGRFSYGLTRLSATRPRRPTSRRPGCATAMSGCATAR